MGDFFVALVVAGGFMVLVVTIFVFLLRRGARSEQRHRGGWNAMGTSLGLRPSPGVPSTIAEASQLFAMLSAQAPVIDPRRELPWFGGHAGRFVAVFPLAFGERDELALILSDPSNRHRASTTTRFFTACRVYLPAPLGLGFDLRTVGFREPDAGEPAARFQPLGTVGGRFRVRAQDIGRVQQLLNLTTPMLVATLGVTRGAWVTDEFVQIELEGRVDQVSIVGPALDAAIAATDALAHARAQV